MRINVFIYKHTQKLKAKMIKFQNKLSHRANSLTLRHLCKQMPKNSRLAEKFRMSHFVNIAEKGEKFQSRSLNQTTKEKNVSKQIDYRETFTNAIGANDRGEKAFFCFVVLFIRYTLTYESVLSVHIYICYTTNANGI